MAAFPGSKTEKDISSILEDLGLSIQVFTKLICENNAPIMV